MSWVTPGPFFVSQAIRSAGPTPLDASPSPSPDPLPQEPQEHTLLDWLLGRYPTAKRQTLKRMVQAGRVRVGRRVAKTLSEVVAPGTEVAVLEGERRPGPESRGARAPFPDRADPRLRIVFEDEDLLVVDKPAGLLTSTVPREPRPTLLAIVRAYVEGHSPGTPVGLIHRLDRDASGLLVFSKNREAFRSLKRQFFDHSVERVYTAVVEGAPNPRTGTIDTRLVERADGTVYSLRRDAEGKGERAVSEYHTLATNGGRSAVRVTLLTGRKHQIRVHLGERGTPIVGDSVYGGEKAAPKKGKRERKPPPPAAPRLMLAATKLSLTHPRTGMRMIFQLPPPKPFGTAFGAEIPVAPPADGR